MSPIAIFSATDVLVKSNAYKPLVSKQKGKLLVRSYNRTYEAVSLGS